MQVASRCTSPHPQVHPSSSKCHIFHTESWSLCYHWPDLRWFSSWSHAHCFRRPHAGEHGSDCRSDCAVPIRVPCAGARMCPDVPGVFLRRPGSTSRGPRRVMWQDSSGSSSSWCQGTEIRTCQRRAVNSFRFRLEMFRNVVFSYRVSLLVLLVLLVSYQA